MQFRLASNFQKKLLLSLMLTVSIATAAVLYLAERNERARSQEALNAQFQDQMRLFTALQDARRATILEKCRAISRSVRLRAALEEDDFEDLYRNAVTELQGIFNSKTPASDENEQQTLHASFFRFLDEQGQVLSPGEFHAGKVERDSVALAPIGRALPKLKEQAVGFLALEHGRGLKALREVVLTKLFDWQGKPLGGLVVGFPVRDIIPTDAAQLTVTASGIWLGEQIYLNPSLSAPDRHLLATRLFERTERQDSGHFVIDLDSGPQMAFYKALDRDQQLEPAYEVCLYPMGNALRRQDVLRWKIVGWGVIVLGAGLVVSLFLAKGLSKPVDKIVAGSVENFTRRRQAEEELREANEQLAEALCELKATQQQVIQQERLRALGEMASGVAHDFNNTLTPILGFTDLLLERQSLLEDKSQTIKFLKLLRTSAQDAASIVRRLREFYRPLDKTDEVAAIALPDLVSQVVALTEPKWKQQAQANGSTIRMQTRLQSVAPVAVDESALREALTNLIFNAVDAMPGGGTLTIETAAEPNYSVIRVSDTGLGMTEEVRQRCLEPFFSTKGEKGTGLGLAMVYGIIERHRGRLEIESKVGEGTTFIIHLPVAENVSVEATTAETDPKSSSPLNVLVVDDEPSIREVVAAFLRSDGHDVATAANGREGFEQFQSHSFDVVITDRAMPEMNGEQMAGMIKHARPEVPVVLLTGFGTTTDGIDKESGSVDVVLNKPVTLNTLLQTIQNLRHAA